MGTVRQLPRRKANREELIEQLAEHEAQPGVQLLEKANNVDLVQLLTELIVATSDRCKHRRKYLGCRLQGELGIRGVFSEELDRALSVCADEAGKAWTFQPSLEDRRG